MRYLGLKKDIQSAKSAIVYLTSVFDTPTSVFDTTDIEHAFIFCPYTTEETWERLLQYKSSSTLSAPLCIVGPEYFEDLLSGKL